MNKEALHSGTSILTASSTLTILPHLFLKFYQSVSVWRACGKLQGPRENRVYLQPLWSRVCCRLERMHLSKARSPRHQRLRENSGKTEGTSHWDKGTAVDTIKLEGLPEAVPFNRHCQTAQTRARSLRHRDLICWGPELNFKWNLSAKCRGWGVISFLKSKVSTETTTEPPCGLGLGLGLVVTASSTCPKVIMGLYVHTWGVCTTGYFLFSKS